MAQSDGTLAYRLSVDILLDSEAPSKCFDRCGAPDAFAGDAARDGVAHKNVHNCIFKQGIIAKSELKRGPPMKLDQTIQQHVEKFPLLLQSAVLDYVLYLEQKTGKQSPTDSERRKSLANALEKVVAINPYAKIDPVAWVREQRDERPLPERE
jgi:hypothetical protein